MPKLLHIYLVLLLLREKCPNTLLPSSVSSRIQTEYGDLRGKSLYLVRIWENMNQKKFCIRTLFTQSIEFFLSNISLKAHPTISSETISDNWKPFKNDEKCFLFDLKSFLWSWDIYNFCPDFFVMLNKGLIRKLWLIFKFMTSQTVKQIITIHNLRNISRSKSNQPIKFGQLIKYSAKNIFLQKLCRK